MIFDISKSMNFYNQPPPSPKPSPNLLKILWVTQQPFDKISNVTGLGAPSFYFCIRDPSWGGPTVSWDDFRKKNEPQRSFGTLFFSYMPYPWYLQPPKKDPNFWTYGNQNDPKINKSTKERSPQPSEDTPKAPCDHNLCAKPHQDHQDVIQIF